MIPSSLVESPAPTNSDPNDTRRTWGRAAISALAASIAVLPALLVSRESYWIDELHSIWVVNGEWKDLVSLASAGNQTPLFFACLKTWMAIGWNTELWARSLSLLTWWLAVVWSLHTVLHLESDDDTANATNACNATTPLTQASTRERWGTDILIATIAVVWLALDWTEFFYASEVRPYAMVGLATVLILRSARWDNLSPSAWNWRWTLTSILVVYLHLTAVLIVLSHWLSRLLLAHRKPLHRRLYLRLRFLELIVWLLCTAPLLGQGQGLMSRARQWQNMSGSLDLTQAIDLIPILPWVALPLFFLWAGGRLGRLSSTSWQSLFVALLPVAWVCILVSLQLAPMGHRRYLMGSFVAAFLFGIASLKHLTTWRPIVCLGLATSLALIGLQGTWRNWREGVSFTWPRQENWREAINYLNQQAPKNAVVYLAPNLVETAEVPHHDPTTVHWPSPSGSSLADYLEFAVRSHYPLREDLRCVLLPNDGTQWDSRIVSSHTNPQWQVSYVLSRQIECPWLDRHREKQYFGRLILWHPTQNQ